MSSPSRIQAPDDPRLAEFRDLRHRGRDASTIVIEGELAVLRALASPIAVKTVVCTASHAERLQLHVGAGVQWLEAEPDVLARVTGFPFHRGVLAAAVRPPASTARPTLLPTLRARGSSTVVLAAGFADPANLGAVLRCARAFAVDLVLVDGRGADPWSRRAIRASAGLVFEQPLIVTRQPAAELAWVRSALPDCEVVAATVDSDATPLRRHHRSPHMVLMFGNEGEGLPASLHDVADHRVRIDMAPGVDSLNVAAAAAVFLWSLRAPVG